MLVVRIKGRLLAEHASPGHSKTSLKGKKRPEQLVSPTLIGRETTRVSHPSRRNVGGETRNEVTVYFSLFHSLMSFSGSFDMASRGVPFFHALIPIRSICRCACMYVGLHINMCTNIYICIICIYIYIYIYI